MRSCLIEECLRNPLLTATMLELWQKSHSGLPRFQVARSGCCKLADGGGRGMVAFLEKTERAAFIHTQNRSRLIRPTLQERRSGLRFRSINLHKDVH